MNGRAYSREPIFKRRQKKRTDLFRLHVLLLVSKLRLCALASSYEKQMKIKLLKGLSHEFFGPVFWAIRMYLGLNVNRLWFLNFNDDPLILDNYFKFRRVSGQRFSEILRISEMDWQLSLRISNFRRFLASRSPRNAA